MNNVTGIKKMKLETYRIQTKPITDNLTSLDPLLMICSEVSFKGTYNSLNKTLTVSITHIDNNQDNDITEYYCSDVFNAVDMLDNLMVQYASSFNFESKDSCNTIEIKKQRGGKREGAGRPVTNPTKPVRLNEYEQRLISEFRTMQGNTKSNLKRLVKFMAVLELKDQDKS